MKDTKSKIDSSIFLGWLSCPTTLKMISFHRYFQYGRIFVGLNQLDYEEFTRRDTLAIPENETVMKNPYVQKQEFMMFFFQK